jgi:hypothetical protein
MEHEHFDELTRSVGAGGTRRAMLRLLAGGVLGVASARLGLDRVAAEETKKPKRKRRTDHEPRDVVQAEGKSKGKKKKKKRKKQPTPKHCDELLAPLCPPCHEPRCDTTTGTWFCHNTCRDGFTCCNGLCEPPCDNGCAMDPSHACICQKPRRGGDVYCAVEHFCAAYPCQPGKEYDASTCTCRDESPQQCGPGWEWCNGACRDTDLGPWIACGNSCCQGGGEWPSECCNGQCVITEFGPYTICGDTCCPDRSDVCCNGECYPNYMAPLFACGDVCCQAKYDQCCGGACCAK